MTDPTQTTGLPPAASPSPHAVSRDNCLTGLIPVQAEPVDYVA